MAREDSKQAEKQYLSRTGGSAWEREKPFSPPGDDTLEDSLDSLHDFAVAARLLHPAPGDRIIDLGAGGGWCSGLLQRLNRKPIAVDISLEMLRVSRERTARAPIKAVAGDFERLPFLDGSFDKALCLSPLQPRARYEGRGLRDLARPDRDGRRGVIGRDFARCNLDVDVAPGESRNVRATFNAPADAGDYGLKFDLVVEGVTWFEPAGTKVAVRPFRVTAGDLTR